MQLRPFCKGGQNCHFGAACWFQHLGIELDFFKARELYNSAHVNDLNNKTSPMDIDHKGRKSWVNAPDNVWKNASLLERINSELPASRGKSKETMLPAVNAKKPEDGQE